MKLEVLFNPKSIAIIGASATTGKVGNSVLQNVIQSGFSGEIYPINPKGGEILGHEAYKSVLDVPGEIDLGVICIPARFAGDAVDECGRKGVKGLIIITAGFKEIGGKGIEREKRIADLAEKYGFPVLGPNCLGIISRTLNASFASQQPLPGDIAFISQSGAMLTGILDWSLGNEIGFSAFVSIGNKVDVDETDLIEYLSGDANTKIILAYLEDIHDGDKFLRVLSQCAKKKPVIILKSGRSEAGAAAASSHTGSLAGSDIAYDLAFEKVGVIRAETIGDLFDYAMVFENQPVPAGKKFAVITNAGGPGIIATDAFEDSRLGFARFSEVCLKELREGLPEEANIFNPVDIIGDAPPERYKFALDTIFKEDPEVCSGALVILTPQAQTNPPGVTKVLIEVAEQFPDKTMIGAYIGGKALHDPKNKLIKHGIPCFDFPEQGIKALKTLELFGDYRQAVCKDEPERFDVDQDRVREIIQTVRDDNRTVLLNYETSGIFEAYGITHPKTRLANSAKDAATFTEDIGFPVVMKVVSPQIMHKSDVGGVVLNIKNREEAINAYVDIISNVKKLGPVNARIYGIEVQEMINVDAKQKSTELIIGVNRDPQFGPLIMFGLGGIFVNFLKDVAFRLSHNFRREDAKKLMQGTKAYSLLLGVRGQGPSDIESLENVLLRIAQLVNDFDDITELDINPILAFAKGEGYSAVDIKITIKS